MHLRLSVSVRFVVAILGPISRPFHGVRTREMLIRTSFPGFEGIPILVQRASRSTRLLLNLTPELPALQKRELMLHGERHFGQLLIVAPLWSFRALRIPIIATKMSVQLSVAARFTDRPSLIPSQVANVGKF